VLFFAEPLILVIFSFFIDRESSRAAHTGRRCVSRSSALLMMKLMQHVFVIITR